MPKAEKQLDGSWSSGYPKENHDSYKRHVEDKWISRRQIQIHHNGLGEHISLHPTIKSSSELLNGPIGKNK